MFGEESEADDRADDTGKLEKSDIVEKEEDCAQPRCSRGTQLMIVPISILTNIPNSNQVNDFFFQFKMLFCINPLSTNK